MALSRDGRVFDRMVVLDENRSTRRIAGRHKEDGIQYPDTLVDDDRLIVMFSTNKEDIECGIVDTTTL